MSQVTKIASKKKQSVSDLYENLSTRLDRIANVGDLIAAANSDSIEVDTLNKTGYMLYDMATEANKLLDELYRRGGEI